MPNILMGETVRSGTSFQKLAPKSVIRNSVQKSFICSFTHFHHFKTTFSICQWKALGWGSLEKWQKSYHHSNVISSINPTLLLGLNSQLVPWMNDGEVNIKLSLRIVIINSYHWHTVIRITLCVNNRHHHIVIRIKLCINFQEHKPSAILSQIL